MKKMKLLFQHIFSMTLTLIKRRRQGFIASWFFLQPSFDFSLEQDYFSRKGLNVQFFGGLLIVGLFAINIISPIKGTGPFVNQVEENLLYVDDSLPLDAVNRAVPTKTSKYNVSSKVQSTRRSGKNANLPAPASSAELISLLKQHGLYNRQNKKTVSPLIVSSFPDDLDSLDVAAKKRVFFNTLLPVALVAMEEVRQERERLLDILAELGGSPGDHNFSANQTVWQNSLADEKVAFIKSITKRYRHVNGAELLKRVDVVPLSLVLAQGAIESSWGTSRFANLGNNLFGMWTWGEKGIVPLGRDDGKTHKVASYDSILSSVRSYILTINRLSAYEELRDIRSRTMDPLLVSAGLLYYSERGEEYVNDLRKVIRHNQLTEYDKYQLAVL